MKWVHNTRLTSIIISTILILLMGFIFHMLYHETKKSCLDVLNRAFISAIHQEKESRLAKHQMFFSCEKSDAPPNQTIIRRENETMILEKPDSVQQLTFYEKLDHVHQTYLFEKAPVDVNILDSLFRLELLKHQLSVQSAVRYQDNINHATYYSRENPAFFAQASCTPPITYGVRNEITLQGFAELTFLSILRKDSKRFVVVFVAWVMTMFFICYSFYQKKRTVAPIPAEQKGQPQIVWDANKHLVIYHNTEVKLPNQSAILFQKLWNQLGHYVSYEELIYSLCGHEGIKNGENRLAQTVRRLRGNLQSMPGVKIENLPHKGYRLLLKTGIEPESKQSAGVST